MRFQPSKAGGLDFRRITQRSVRAIHMCGKAFHDEDPREPSKLVSRLVAIGDGGQAFIVHCPGHLKNQFTTAGCGRGIRVPVQFDVANDC